MKGTFTTQVWVTLGNNPEKHLAEYVIEDISLEEAKYAVNHGIFTGGKFVSLNDTIWL